jgi:hypothetical protein
MMSNLVDLTHDTLPEVEWRPIKKYQEPIPPPNVVNDKIELVMWEMGLRKEFFSKTYNRIYFDEEVFKKFISNGKIIKMLVDPNDLQDAKEFWKNEEEITKVAAQYIRGLKRQKVYDFHDINPQAYDLRAGMDGKGKKNIKREKGVKKGGGEGGGEGGKKEKKGDDDEEDMAKVLEQKQAGLAVNKQSAL